ncbi:MAG: hypothetical protein Q9226_001457 [Calogaya cf. arnoldii]
MIISGNSSKVNLVIFFSYYVLQLVVTYRLRSRVESSSDMTKRIEKFGLKKAIPSHGRAGASKLNGRPTLETDDAVTPRTNLAVQRTTNEDHRLVFEVYADGEGCLKLATTSVIRNGEKVIIDAVAPLVQDHNSKYFGSRLKTKLARRKKFSNQKQSNGSNASTSFSEYCSPGSTRPSALSADLDEDSTPGDRINTPDLDSEDGCHESDDDDDDGEHLLETESEQFDILTPGDVTALEVYYTKGVCQVGQLTMKKVLKQWVKVKQPKKQSANPYNGRKNRPQQERERKDGKPDPNPGISTAPDWWPTQDGWPTKGCRHKEPDHLRKPERTILALRLLSLTGTEGCEDFTVDKLIESTEGIEMSPNQRRMLDQLYEVRKKQQAFQHDEIDAWTKIPVFRPKGQPSQKKRRVNTKRKRVVRKVKQERRETSETVDQSTRGPPASMSESAQSFGSSDTPLATAKIEPPQHSTDNYENYVEANYLPMFDTPRFEPTTTAPSVYRPMFASPTPIQNSILQEIPPFAHAMARAPSERGRMAFRNDNRYRRRPTSVCKQNSPSYQNGAVPREVGWFQTDDMYCGVRPPLVSSGYPHTGLPIGLDDPMSHSHGVLPPEQQQQECMKYNCTNYTPMERHELGVLRHGWQLPLQHQQGGMSQFHNQPLSFNNQQGFPQSHSPQLHFSNFQGGMSHSHGLDVAAIEQLMSDEDLTPDGSLNRSLGHG